MSTIALIFLVLTTGAATELHTHEFHTGSTFHGNAQPTQAEVAELDAELAAWRKENGL